MNILKENYFTYTIVGAGASGLWLAYALLEQGLLDNHTLCIVESDIDKGNDRTWCFWDVQTTIPAEIISKVWSDIYNQHSDSETDKLDPFQYYHIRSADFYAYIKKCLSKNNNVFWKNEHIHSTRNVNSQVEIVSNLSTWYSDYSFLSTLPEADLKGKETIFSHREKYLQNLNNKKQDLFLWQSFIGWRVETQQNVFIDNRISMMQFNVNQGGSTQFIYELPFDKKHALVEMTRFGKDKLSKFEAETELKKFMNNKGCSYTIIEEEIGAIPMTTTYDISRKYLVENERIIYIGVVAGALKPTTGYGFKRMKEYGESLAKAIKYQKKIPTMHRLWRFRLYDTLLLSILKSQPEKGKQIFEALFKTQPIQRILRFLDEETTVWDEIKIFIRLPIRLFLKFLIKHIALK